MFDNYATRIDIEGRTYNFNLLDTAGQEGYEELRKFTYPGTNVFVICFAVDLRSSFENVEAKVGIWRRIPIQFIYIN